MSLSPVLALSSAFALSLGALVAPGYEPETSPEVTPMASCTYGHEIGFMTVKVFNVYCKYGTVHPWIGYYLNDNNPHLYKKNGPAVSTGASVVAQNHLAHCSEVAESLSPKSDRF